MPEEPRVLVVEDEVSVSELYATWLSEEYDVRVANDGETAFEELDDAVDVVLLDRRMPGLSGDEVLEGIRDRGLSCRVAMVTAVEPDFDIVEMGFDDYLIKPVTDEDLLDAVEDLLERLSYDERLQEYYAVAAKLGALEAAKSRMELSDSEEYDRLQERFAALGDEADAALEEPDDFENAFRDLSGPAQQAGK